MEGLDTPLAFFGLDEDASASDVKRAYARRLKATRPDEDPEGFQRLRAMYSWALEIVSGEGFEAPVDLPPDASGVDEVVDVDPLYARIVELGQQSDGAAMSEWLVRQEVLWSLTYKAAAAAAIARRLHAELPPMAPAAFDVLFAFFVEWHVDRGDDPCGMEALRPSLLIRWYLQSANHDACAQLLVERKFVSTPRAARVYLRQITQPFRVWRALLWSLIPMVPTRMRVVMRALRPLPETLDARQLAWWTAAADRTQLSWPRTAVGLSRACVYALGVLPVAYALGLRGATLGWTMAIAEVYCMLAWTGQALRDAPTEDAEERHVAMIAIGAAVAMGSTRLAVGVLFLAVYMRACVFA